MIEAFHNRRGFIRNAVAVLGLCIVPSGAHAVGRRAKNQATRMLGERMASFLSPRPSAAFVGRTYLRGIPPEHRSIEHLMHEVCFRHCATSALCDLDVEDLHTCLGTWIADDFHSGSVAMVEGWMLSRTEAALAGLAATLELSNRRQQP